MRIAQKTMKDRTEAADRIAQTVKDLEAFAERTRLNDAAPDLLAACKAVVEALKAAPIMETDWKLPGSYAAWKACVDAVAKVEGR